MIMKFVIPVVFYEITKVECVYWFDTTIFIGRICSVICFFLGNYPAPEF